MDLTFTSALLIGFLGSAHCLGMCGGLSMALGLQNRAWYLLSYNLGRLATYTALGAALGLIGQQLVSHSSTLAVLLRGLAGLLIITMGLYVSQWWMGLTRIEKVGAALWQYLQPLTKSLLPANNHRKTLQLGILWGLLPCGLVYSTLTWALTTAHWQQSALLMLAFGIGTLPAMLSMGLLNQQLLQRFRGRNVRTVAGVFIMLMGVLTLLSPWLHQGDHGHDHHHAHNHGD